MIEVKLIKANNKWLIIKVQDLMGNIKLELLDKGDKMNTPDIKQKALEDCIDYIITVSKKQGFLMPKGILYGDGTRFPLLSRQGFNLCWECVEETFKDLQVIV